MHSSQARYIHIRFLREDDPRKMDLGTWELDNFYLALATPVEVGMDEDQEMLVPATEVMRFSKNFSFVQWAILLSSSHSRGNPIFWKLSTNCWASLLLTTSV